MHNYIKLTPVFLLLILQATCSGNYRKITPPVQGTDSLPIAKPVVPKITEVSGIADSKQNPGFLWAEEDSGNPPQLYLIGHDGKVAKKLRINGAENRDWEDIALSNNQILIGDIGDNSRIFSEYAFYVFPEPEMDADEVNGVKKIRFRYPDEGHDAEAFLVDPQTQNILIITKRDHPSKIYELSYPYNTAGVTTVKLVGTLSYTGVVSAALSPDSKKILLKTYNNLNLYTRNKGESLVAALTKGTPELLPYTREPQGEAVTFKNDGSGFFTLSEQVLFGPVQLFFYPVQE